MPWQTLLTLLSEFIRQWFLENNEIIGEYMIISCLTCGNRNIIYTYIFLFPLIIQTHVCLSLFQDYPLILVSNVVLYSNKLVLSPRNGLYRQKHIMWEVPAVLKKKLFIDTHLFVTSRHSFYCTYLCMMFNKKYCNTYL